MDGLRELPRVPLLVRDQQRAVRNLRVSLGGRDDAQHGCHPNRAAHRSHRHVPFDPRGSTVSGQHSMIKASRLPAE
jgi:hypothetical protein